MLVETETIIIRGIWKTTATTICETDLSEDLKYRIVQERDIDYWANIPEVNKGARNTVYLRAGEILTNI